MGFKFKDEVIEGDQRDPEDGGPIPDVTLNGNSISAMVIIIQGENTIFLSDSMAEELRDKLNRI